MRTRLALCALAVLFVAADPAATPPKLRLPSTVRPTHYALELRVVPAQPTFSGMVTIDLRVDQPTSLVWLNATGLTIESGELRAGGATQAARVVAGGEDFVGFATPKPIARGTAQLIVRWHGALDAEKSRGLYRVAEGAGGG